MQGCSISKVALSLPFSFLQKNGFIECNKCVGKTILLGTVHPFLLAKLGSLNTLWLLCCVIPTPPMEKSVPESLKQGSFGAGGLHAGHTAEECRYLGLLWKGPAERSLGCTVLSISLPPPGFGREQIPSRIIGLRS